MSDILRKLGYMLNMESGSNFEYLASLSEKEGNKNKAMDLLKKSLEKYIEAYNNASTPDESQDSEIAKCRVRDRIDAMLNIKY